MNQAPQPNYSIMPVAPHGQQGLVLASGGYPAAMVPYVPPQYGPVPTQQASVIALEDVLKLILKRWKSALLISSTLAGLLFLFLTGRTPKYTAEASLLMQTQDNKVFAFDKTVAHIAEVNSIPSLLNNHKNQLTTRRFHEFLFTRLEKADVDAFLTGPSNPPIVSRILGKLSAVQAQPAPGAPPTPVDEFCRAMASMKADYIKETHLLKVQVVHHDPTIAAKIANAATEGYRAYLATEEAATIKQAMDFHEKQAVEVKQRVETAGQALAAFRSEKGIIGETDIQGLSAEKMKLLATEVARAEVEQSKLEQSLNLIRAANSNMDQLLSVEAISAYPTVAAVRPQWLDILREKESVEAVYLSKHPRYIETHSRYALIEGELRRAVAMAMQETQNKHTSLTKQIQSLRGQVQTSETAVLDQGKSIEQKNLLTRQLQVDSALYEKLMSRLNELRVASQFQENTYLRVADKAMPPEKPTSPNKAMGMVLSGLSFASLFVIIPLLLALIATLREKGLSGTLAALRAPQQAAASPAMGASPMLAAMPGVAMALPAPSALLALDIKDLGIIPGLAEGNISGHQALVQAFQNQTPSARAFTQLSQSLAAQDGPRPHILLVTSASPLEGKSQVAAGLAAASVMDGRKTLLIDCHAASPGLSKWLPQANGVPGLKQLLLDGESIFDLNILRYATSDLFVLHAGGPNLPSGLFASPSFAELLRSHLRQVDTVVLDGPAVANLPALAPLASLANQLLLVSDPRRTPAEQVRWAAGMLQRSAPHCPTLNSVQCV